MQAQGLTKAVGNVQVFTAVLEPDGGGLGWVVAYIPFVPADVWPDMLRLRVRGEINGFAFRTSLFTQTRGGYFLPISRVMQKGADAHAGSMAAFRLEPDLEQRPAELPDELALLLEDEDGLRLFYDGMSEYERREIGKWVNAVHSEEARLRRAGQMAERLLQAMEGLRELPPIVEAAFRRRPKARLGWPNLTETQRRRELFAVFGYQSPESREKRVQGLCDAAEKRAGT